MRYSDDPKHIGSKLGPKLAAIISETIVTTKRKLLDTEHRARVHSMQEVIDRAGREIADLYKPVWDATLAQQDMPDVVRAHVDKIMSGRHQWQAIAGIALGYSGAANGLSQVISNYLAPAVRAALEASPELIPAVNDIVTLHVKGVIDQGEALADIAGQGINNNLAQALFTAAYGYPDLSTTLELLRRDMILGQDAGLFMTRNGIAPEVQDLLLQLVKVPLSPADLADMVVRDIKTQGEAAKVAAQSGVDAADFDALVLDTGEPLALQQLLEAFRRGFIDQARLERGIRQGRTRNEWIDVAERLRFSPMSVADAVNSVVQNHMDKTTGNAIAEQNGLEPGSFDILLQTAGEPLSRTEMQELYNRGLVTREQVDQAQRESRLKDKYIPYSFELHRRIMPVNYVQRALRYGAISHDAAVRAVMDNGFNQADAEVLVTSGSAEKMQTFKNRVVSAVETAYEENTISDQTALSMITSLGFEDSEAAFVVQAAGFRRDARIVNQAIGLIRGRYVQHRLSRQQASNDLDSVNVPAPQRDFMLNLWDIEYAAHTRGLTEAQVIRAMKKSTITPDDALQRLLDMGYSQDDATILIQDA